MAEPARMYETTQDDVTWEDALKAEALAVAARMDADPARAARFADRLIERYRPYIAQRVVEMSVLLAEREDASYQRGLADGMAARRKGLRALRGGI